MAKTVDGSGPAPPEDGDARRPRPVDERLEDLRRRKDEALVAGGEKAIERQHARGKLTARERL